MGFLEFCEKPLVFDYRETVSKVSSKMSEEKKHEAVVFENGEYSGMVFAREFVKRKVNNPQKTEIKKFMTNVGLVSANEPEGELISYMLINDYKSVPVTKNGDILVLTRLGLLKSVKNLESFRGKKIGDLMIFPYSVNINDSIATAMSVLRDAQVSRLPVVNENSEIEGLLDTIDLLKANVATTRQQRGDRVGDKIKKRNANISSLMIKNVPVLSPGDSVRKALEEMEKRNAWTILVSDKKKLVGIITPKMLLKLAGKEKAGVLVNISGIRDEDPFIKSLIDDEINNAISKLNKIMRIEAFNVHVDKYHETGDRAKYSVKARMMTERGMLFADDFAWDLTKAFRGVLVKLEKEIKKKKDKSSGNF